MSSESRNMCLLVALMLNVQLQKSNLENPGSLPFSFLAEMLPRNAAGINSVRPSVYILKSIVASSQRSVPNFI